MKTTPPRTLFWFSLFTMVALVIVVGVNNQSVLPPAIKIDIEGQPTIGYTKARVHVVVFEEPKCSNCKDFNNEIFPKIKEQYIETNKVTYTFIPVSFLPDSMPAAIALLSVYHQNPPYTNSDLFFTYLDTMYLNQPPEHINWATTEKLLELAKEASPAIHLDQLKQSIEQQAHIEEVKKNTLYGDQLMGQIQTPTVYINGIEVEELTFDEISDIIDQQLQQVGG